MPVPPVCNPPINVLDTRGAHSTFGNVLSDCHTDVPANLCSFQQQRTEFCHCCNRQRSAFLGRDVARIEDPEAVHGQVLFDHVHVLGVFHDDWRKPTCGYHLGSGAELLKHL